MNKTIKKIVALGMGATMLAGTAAMALAADLSAYPSPFVKDGAFVGKIVIGEKAASIDVVGAMDVAASLQRASAVSVGTTGSTGTSTAADGFKFSANTDLVLGSTLLSVASTVDDTDLPEFLASGTIQADDGTEYDYDVSVSLTGSVGAVNAAITSDLEDEGYTTPIVYLDTTPTTGLLYTVVVDFQDNWNASEFVNSETIHLFGTEYTFDPDNEWNDDVLTLFGSETTMLIAKGAKETVTYMGKEYTIEVLGGNSDDSSAIVRINGDTKTMTEGDSKTLGGLPIYVKDVFVSNIGGDDVSVNIFVGSNKLELDTDGSVTKNGVELDGVILTGFDAAKKWGDVSELTFAVYPQDTEDEVDYILPGDSFVDPVFGAFKIEFVGAEDLTAGKELVELNSNGDTLELTFTPRGGTEYSLELATNGDDSSDFWNVTTLKNLHKDDVFIWNDGTADDNMVTHVLKVVNIDEGNNTDDADFLVEVEDLTFDKKYSASDRDDALSNDLTLYPIAGSADDSISFSTSATGSTNATTNFSVYTNAGALIVVDTLTNRSAPTFAITEDVDADYDTVTAGEIEGYTAAATWNADDDQYEITLGGVGTEYGAEDDINYYLTKFGTYTILDTDADTKAYAKLYIPHAEVTYDAFLMPVNSEVTVSAASTGGAVALNPISVGMAILDSEASLGSKPYIVIGGPCANTVAAALMGNKDNCAEGFTEGKATIKLFSDKNALLVAGYSGKDTQGACRVLANYNTPKYALTGTEVEVMTANLVDMTVKKVV